jgi:hypothetical protein
MDAPDRNAMGACDMSKRRPSRDIYQFHADAVTAVVTFKPSEIKAVEAKMSTKYLQCVADDLRDGLAEHTEKDGLVDIKMDVPVTLRVTLKTARKLVREWAPLTKD